MTYDEYVALCKAENPPPLYAHVNGVEIELTPEEYDDAVDHWATMRVEQDGGDE
jgi:hypothetical protein